MIHAEKHDRREQRLCHCGKPLHYSNASVQRVIEAVIAEHGETVIVRAGERAFIVPRHYIALHGIQTDELPLLGFTEVSELP